MLRRFASCAFVGNGVVQGPSASGRKRFGGFDGKQAAPVGLVANQAFQKFREGIEATGIHHFFCILNQLPVDRDLDSLFHGV